MDSYLNYLDLKLRSTFLTGNIFAQWLDKRSNATKGEEEVGHSLAGKNGPKIIATRDSGPFLSGK